MWKYLAALLVVLLSLGGLGVVAAQTECVGICYANVITQTDVQKIENVRIGFQNSDTETTEAANSNVAIGNEGLSAAIIVTKDPSTTLADETS